MSLVERIGLLDDALRDFPHAFGGALALAYYAEPRSTVDIDLNIFVPVSELDRVTASLVSISVPANDPQIVEVARRDGQVRVFWDDVPLDLFFSYNAFHVAAAAARRRAPLANRTIEILSPEHLMACKIIFNRPKHWVDLDSMLEGGLEFDSAEVLRWVTRVVGDEDERSVRAVTLVTSSRR